MVSGLELINNAASEAIRRFDGDANGIMLMPNANNRRLSSSIKDAILAITLLSACCSMKARGGFKCIHNLSLSFGI